MNVKTSAKPNVEPKNKKTSKKIKNKKLSKKSKNKKTSNKKTDKKKFSVEQELTRFFKKRLNSLKQEELKELMLINSFKLTIVRSQIDALLHILKKKKIVTYEEFWKTTKQFLEESMIE